LKDIKLKFDMNIDINIGHYENIKKFTDK